MKLRALRLHGFKSFADKTKVVFHDGITAIVGPNGCGKSNISDAIRWVLGEQRPTAIRGAKMEEAIFQGTVNRRPVNRGSVSMEVTNEDGALPVPFSEVEITRTVYRDGGSDYLLNRSACRLRDIQELCRDTGLGANAYAIIENRMIDALLSDRAEERRGLFEEAAGVGKYKDRRREASRRLERAEVDLQRLEDLIAEVQSKVRSLARQKGAAERYAKLRKRRLDLEMTTARGQLEELGSRLAEVRRGLTGEVPRDESLKASVSEAESRLEELRIEQLTEEKARVEAAKQAEKVRGELVRWERDLAVAEERSTYAKRRLGQIEVERSEAAAELEDSETRDSEAEARKVDLDSALEVLGVRIGEHDKSTEEARGELAAAREALSDVEAREREVTRRVAQLQADTDVFDVRGRELEDRIARLESELQEAREGLSEAASQGDLFTGRVESLLNELEEARSGLEERVAEVKAAREALDSAREVERRAQDRFGVLHARQSALAVMDREKEGVDPAVQAVLADPPSGVLGIVADFVSTDPEYSAALDTVLGVFLRALVVRDTKVAVRLSNWFRDEWEGGGGLVVLPLDRVPEGEPSGDLLDRVRPEGEGAPWVAALLGKFALDGEPDAGPTRGSSAGVFRAARDGGWVERDGVFHLGNPMGSTGILERRQQLAELQVEADRADSEAEDAGREREEAAARVEEQERSLLEARSALQASEDAYREARSEQTERSNSLTRIERTVEELDRQLSAAKESLEVARARVEDARSEREELLGEEDALRDAMGEARSALDRVQHEWEGIRAESSRLEIERTRLVGDLARIADRRRDFALAIQTAHARAQALDDEAKALSEDLDRATELEAEGRVEIEKLFELRESAEVGLKSMDRTLTELQERILESEREVREARNQERAAAEERHALELEEQELRGRVGRIQERLEGEWGKSLERLLEEAEDVEGEEEELRAELSDVVRALDRIGLVNMLAVEEHAEEGARLDFLTEQRDDLVSARDDLRAAIREINETATALFTETFDAIRLNFRDTFVRLFEGGECDLWLAEPDDPLESDVEIHAAPHGKRTQRIDLLSGGERALTALSLLFGIYLVKPSPFCVLDEVDAPLDESNIGRFIRLLQEFKSRSQFIVITHNPQTIEAADWIYGVTMEEPGVSSIVGVQLDETVEAATA